MKYETNDFVLIKLLKEDDQKSFTFLMNNYYERLCVYANLFTKDSAESEDIVQNVFVKIWTRRNKLNENISIKSYLYKSVYNEFIDHYRKNKPLVPLDEKYIKEIDSFLEKDEMSLQKAIIKLNEGIDKLPSKCREIFILSKKEGLSNDEISKHLNISLKTVEGHITRGFKALNHSLGGKMDTLFFIFFKHTY
jgi:RNA polymerase sigma-70 factor (ECF subfamily)|tara:strand:+ start:487 stop:1065 length:579 start_codon:yes stop_codon:yes gene_type:complete